jgi:epoxyqueuosine reductase
VVLADELRDIGLAAGLDAVGIAPAAPFDSTRRVLEERRADGLHGGMQFTFRNPARSTDPSAALPGATAIVVGARSYARDRVDAPLGPSGAVARYASSDHYAELRGGLGAVARRLEEDGWRTVVAADDNALVDREAAVRAGLGWYGKSTNVLLPGRGSWFVLGSVITDAPLPPDAPAAEGCGACTRCLDACPTGAIVAPGVLDARRCLAWLVQAAGVFPREHRVALGDRLYGCDDCQEVCPPNLARSRHGLPSADEQDEPWVPLLELLAASDSELLARHGRWYIPEREPRYLRRNALVVLGNVGDGTDPRVVSAVESALVSEDAIVRAHAVWAAARLGRTDLLSSLMEREKDPIVRAELVSLPVPR